jgi:hypothetical protein
MRVHYVVVTLLQEQTQPGDPAEVEVAAGAEAMDRDP